MLWTLNSTTTHYSTHYSTGLTALPPFVTFKGFHSLSAPPVRGDETETRS